MISNSNNSMCLRSFFCEEAKIKQHTSSKKELCEIGEEAISESRFTSFLLSYNLYIVYCIYKFAYCIIFHRALFNTVLSFEFYCILCYSIYIVFFIFYYRFSLFNCIFVSVSCIIIRFHYGLINLISLSLSLSLSLCAESRSYNLS